MNALPGIAGLWGLIALYCLLLRSAPFPGVRRSWLIMIVFAASFQACFAALQLTLHFGLSGARPVGGFLQANVLGSFLATGLACALWLYLSSGERALRAGAGTALVILSASLVLVQSRAADLGAGLAALLLLWQHRRHGVSWFPPTCLMLTGISIGLLWLYGGHFFFPDSIPAPVSKSGSNAARLYMLKLTWQLIMAHPLSGNGYGGFEALFGQLASVTPPGLEADTVTHPHNELLYAWLEGGITALCGSLMIAGGVFIQLWRAGGMRMNGLALLLPIVTHMGLEFPLYLSVTHGLVLVMLLIVTGPQYVQREPSGQSGIFRVRSVHRKAFLCRGLLAIVAGMVVLYMLTGFISQQRLMQIEKQSLMPFVMDESAALAQLPNHTAIFSRLDFDRHVALLLRYNRTRDPALLDAFYRWGERYRQTHNDPGVWNSLLMIARTRSGVAARVLCEDAHGRWPKDPRFVCTAGVADR
ncbi:O-antigen ligase C-terminal domain-containing protein [Klebsiella aerogenes]|nr:O-antigen ligase C-terminal domain-containing protein [Klebsiella aerogenes]ELY3087851.1 O-antigen ligase C-terminal domain-containing protein [Klebsiella aerogenes]